jgi:transposase-like protein
LEVVMGRKRKYSAEVYAEIVRRAYEPGARVIDVARDFDVNARTIRQWRRRLESELDPDTRQAREEHAELVALRRRVRVLEEEREILAKAAAFIAREAGRTP